MAAPGRTTRPRISSKVVTALVLVAVALTFIMQNRQTVEILLFVPKITAPLWITMIVVMVIGLIAGYLLAWRRHR